MDSLNEIKAENSFEALLPPVPENYDDLNGAEQSFYNHIRWSVQNLEHLMSRIRIMRGDCNKAAFDAKSAYDSASNEARTRKEADAARAVKGRTDAYIRDTAENLKYVTQNLNECLKDIRPLLYPEEQF